MANAYSLDLRCRVVDFYLSGGGDYRQVAKQFDVGWTTVRRWVTIFLSEGGFSEPGKGGGRLSDVDVEQIVAIIHSLGDPNAVEITAEYNLGRHGDARRHVSSIKRALTRMGMVLKKNSTTP